MVIQKGVALGTAHLANVRDRHRIYDREEHLRYGTTVWTTLLLVVRLEVDAQSTWAPVLAIQFSRASVGC